MRVCMMSRYLTNLQAVHGGEGKEGGRVPISDVGVYSGFDIDQWFSQWTILSTKGAYIAAVLTLKFF